MIAAQADAPPDGSTPALRVALLLTRFRARYLWNALRSRTTRLPVLVLLVGLFSSVAYVGLFVQSFAAITLATDLNGQAAALALIVGTIVCGGLAAKAAGSDAVLAGSPENEFLLARPVSLSSLVVARSLAAAATDPVGALFIFPVLLAAALTWNLPTSSWVLAAGMSLLVQVGVSAAAQLLQIALVRVVAPRRRRTAWVALRLLASLALASLWMTGTWVLRSPARFAHAVEGLATPLAFSPGGIIVRPLLAAQRGDAAGVALGLAGVLAMTVAIVLLAVRVARSAGMHGWEEAGAAWADASAHRPAPTRHPPTAATKDLRLLLRDRSQLLALVAMPIIFVGIQIFGAAGWSWSTESVQRVSYLSFSLCLYMATIGPLAHMQSERRAFWILLTVPVSMTRLMAAKARAWSLIVGGTAALVFLGLSIGSPPVGALAFATSGLLVVGGAVGMTWLAVALACQAADLSDEQRPAVGPATIYRFLLIGGLFNLLLSGDTETQVRGLLLYALAVVAFWVTGMRQVTACLDPEAARQRRPWLGDAATFAVCGFLGARGAAAVLRLTGEGDATSAIIGWTAANGLLGLIAAIYVARLPRLPAGLRAARTTALALIVGAVLAAALRREMGGALDQLWQQVGAAQAPGAGLVAVAVTVSMVLCDEVIFRAMIQRALHEQLQRPLLAAVAATLLALLVAPPGTPVGQALTIHGLMAVVWMLSLRTWPCVLARLIMIGLLAAFPGTPL